MFIKNKKGQVAIFIVFVFQALFILFAMTINVALVVHDKINFQNSLDLAAYYGAKQQAEVLNAMAHINYQMRQNWKLLAWRYRILGTLLQDEGHPSVGAPQNYWCPQNTTKKIHCTSTHSDCMTDQNCVQVCQEAQASPLPYQSPYCDTQYFVCISNHLWKRGIDSSNQTLCKTQNFKVHPINPPLIHNPALPWMGAIIPDLQRITSQLQQEISSSCPTEGALNWLMTQMFLTHFRLDQKDRKSMLRTIYNKTLKVGKDLDGKDIFKGAQKVFYNNLSKANKTNAAQAPYGLAEFNSFKDIEFKDVFKPFNVWPVLQYLDFAKNDPNQEACGDEIIEHYKNSIVKSGRFIFSDYNSHWDDIKDRFFNQGDKHPLYDFLNGQQKALFSLNHEPLFFNKDENEGRPIRTLTLGFYKDKEKNLYYGLKAQTDYKSASQVFSLFSLSRRIVFKASAFAKVFGGSFGPQPEQTDPMIPIHHPDANHPISASHINPALFQPNYSRWPGEDTWGLIEWNLHSNNSSPNNYSNFLKKHDTYPDTHPQVYTIDAFFHLILYGDNDSRDDPLARPNTGNLEQTFMRMMELLAVYPDAYDLSFYSIASNYIQTYFPRICKLLLNGTDCNSDRKHPFAPNPATTDNWPVFIRGDLGWPNSDHYIQKNQAAKNVQLSIAPYFLQEGDGASPNFNINKHEVLPPDPNAPPPVRPAVLFETPGESNYLTKGRIFYPWLAQKLPDYLLSSWATQSPSVNRKRYEYYDFPEKNFLHCENTALEDMPVPSACVVGGRVGYSVKLISCETVDTLSPSPNTLGIKADYCP